MSFVSLQFALFLPLAFLLHYAMRSKSGQNAVLVLASYTFYGAWDYRFCLLMFISSATDYVAGLLLQKAQSSLVRKIVLWSALGINLSILGLFKYFNFFVDSAVILLAGFGLDANTSSLSIILPVGISFYTFQTMGTTIDVYRGKLAPERNLIDYLAFVSFFPQLVAGPIERAADLLPQFRRFRLFSYEQAIDGLRLVLWGLVKKMLIADNLAGFVQHAYGNPNESSGALLLLGTIAFAFQIYADFSGYSDIAAGIGRLFGIRLMRNFAYPYFAASVTEFWHRWHISLSTWFRDYVYIPLGGSRGTHRQIARNISLTFLVSGLWHGASWMFVAWGGFHAALLLAERYLGSKERPEANDRFRGLRVIRTFALVCAGWVLFRAESVGEAVLIWNKMAGALLSPDSLAEIGWLLAVNWPMAIAVLLFLAVEWLHRDLWNPLPQFRFSPAGRWAFYTLLFWVLIGFGTNQTSDFIYFQF